MEDKQIIDLYFSRSERAISETSQKYGRYCHSIALNILKNKEDSEECVNDTYWKVWNAIPPQKPLRFSAFLAKITRNLALHLYEHKTAKKRMNDSTSITLEELEECLPARDNVEASMEELELVNKINQFLADLPEITRKVFLRRYWYFSPIKEIAIDFGWSESKVKMVLLRTRNSLKQALEQEYR